MLSDLMFALVVLCFIAAFVLSFLKISRSAQRRIYWSCACMAGVFGALATYPTWDNAVSIGIFLVAAMAFMAYACTPYIKVGGKIYSLTIMDPDPEDAPTTAGDSTRRDTDLHPESYSGLLTATTAWWLFMVPAVAATANVYFFIVGEGRLWVAIVSASFLCLLTVGTAYGDASWRYPIARGQYLQFGVASVLTAGVFPAMYLTAYYIAQRRPLRRKQSMEYRVHPRHRKLDS